MTRVLHSTVNFAVLSLPLPRWRACMPIPDGNLPWISPQGSRDIGYWIGCGLVHDHAAASASWATYLTVSWVSDHDPSMPP